MRKLLFLLLLPVFCEAQTKYVDLSPYNGKVMRVPFPDSIAIINDSTVAQFFFLHSVDYTLDTVYLPPFISNVYTIDFRDSLVYDEKKFHSYIDSVKRAAFDSIFKPNNKKGFIPPNCCFTAKGFGSLNQIKNK